MSEHDETPFLSMWLGNFYEPFYSSRDAVRAALEDIAGMGFTSVNLDSKAWQDFYDRAAGAPASPYVDMQEFMMGEAARMGLDYTFLALYLNGDNLYPNVRDVPAVRGEEPVSVSGSPMHTYLYSSPRAQEAMRQHVANLLRLYGAGIRRRPDGRAVMQTMFEPIPRPSFDAAGQERYRTWLADRYGGDVDLLAKRYQLPVASFADLAPDQYWLRPEELSWVGCALPAAGDVERRTPEFHTWVDNQTYLGAELLAYFATMRGHWRRTSPPLYVEPMLHQWGYLFNPPDHVDWQTGQRALDPFRVARHVDSVLFIANPLNAEGLPDPYVLSVEGAAARGANGGRRFTAGLYLGRHVEADVYASLSPAEAIATQVAAGADGFHVYGYSGLDDGGVLWRTDELFRDSVRAGMEWARRAIPLLTEPRDREVALLLPAETVFYLPGGLDPEGRERTDLLGWFRQAADLGWNVDVVHPDQVIAGALGEYRHLLVPSNPLYGVGGYGDWYLGEAGGNPVLEAAVHDFAAAGGTVLHGPRSELARRAFGIAEEEVAFDAIAWEEDLVPHGWSTTALTSDGEPLARFVGSGRPAILRTPVGDGAVISFGFEYGYAYARRSTPTVPWGYGRREMHPLGLLTRTPVEAVIGRAPNAPLPPVRGVEVARFGSKAVVVNHRPSPLDLTSFGGTSVPLLGEHRGERPGWVAAHSAALLDTKVTR